MLVMKSDADWALKKKFRSHIVKLKNETVEFQAFVVYQLMTQINVIDSSQFCCAYFPVLDIMRIVKYISIYYDWKSQVNLPMFVIDVISKQNVNHKQKEELIVLIPRKWVPDFPFEIDNQDIIYEEYNRWKGDISDYEHRLWSSFEIAQVLISIYDVVDVQTSKNIAQVAYHISRNTFIKNNPELKPDFIINGLYFGSILFSKCIGLAIKKKQI